MTTTETDNNTLTQKQHDIYEYIVGHWGANCGNYPTIREIGVKFGMSSSNGVVSHLKALEKKGRIVIDRGQARGIRVPALTAAVEKIADNLLAQLRRERAA